MWNNSLFADPPDTITLFSSKLTRRINQQETFTCRISGSNPPNPTLTIYRKKGRIQRLQNGTGPTLELSNRTMVKDDDGANFYCESSLKGYQSVSKKSNVITYTVQCKFCFAELTLATGVGQSFATWIYLSDSFYDSCEIIKASRAFDSIQQS
jgi:hypothetical protein